MSSLAFIVIASAALLLGDIKQENRLQVLSLHISPPPGSSLTLSDYDLSQARNLQNKAKLRGFIRVSPPAGHCFTIQSDPYESDLRVCKQTNVPFTLEDLSREGRLDWLVSTGEGDFGTKISWPTPYRLAIVTPWNKSLEDPPEYRFIERCEAQTDRQRGRRIKLKLVGGETWIIAFPDKDGLLPQPAPPANLMLATASKAGIGSGNNKENSEAKSDAAAKDEKPSADATKSEVNEDRKTWHLPIRDSYEMPVENFMPAGAVTPGGKGRCRYRFKGPPEDPHTGRIECHGADRFLSVLIPLTCIKELAPK